MRPNVLEMLLVGLLTCATAPILTYLMVKLGTLAYLMAHERFEEHKRDKEENRY